MSLLLEIKDLCVEVFSDNKFNVILDNVNIIVKKGEITSLIGRSGEGKTVFSMSLLGLLGSNFKISKGKVFFNQREFNFKELKSLRGGKIFYIPQNSLSSLNPVLKIRKQIEEVKRISDKEMIDILKDLGLRNYDRILNSYPFEISGGQAQRVVIAIGLCLNPELLIFDEPTSSLDEKNREAFGILIKKIVKKYNKGILLISHNMEFVKKFSNKIYKIENKKIIKVL